MPRDRDVILKEAEGLINPPRGAQLTACIDAARRHHQETVNLPPPGEMKDLAATYMGALRKARKAADAVRSFSRSDDFTAALDREILRVHMEARDCLVVPDGARPRDEVADVAAALARELIGRQHVTLTYGGPWLQLTGLIYEGATGESGREANMMKACREVDQPRPPRYVVRLPFK
jgi:hypothetical protein